MWPFMPGQVVKRQDVHDVVGGQRQSGIVTPKEHPYIVVFSDPKHGAQYGYSRHEGLREDGSFAYTGQGQIGDQQFSLGNKALIESPGSGKTIHLFTARGTEVTYAGTFILGDKTHDIKRADDLEGNEREIIVFNLVPLDSSSDALWSFGNTPEAKPLLVSEWKAPNFEDYLITRGRKEGTEVATRAEFELQHDFGNWLQSLGHLVQELPIQVGKSVIAPDLFDATTGMIFEAKKSNGRGYVRTAIGQVLDYVNNAKRSFDMETTPGILLPSLPAEDLCALCRELGISIYYRFESGFKSND